MLLDQLKTIPSSAKDLRKFGLTVGIAFMLLAAVLYYFDKEAYKVMGSLGGSILLLGLVVPIVLWPLQKVWMSVAIVVGWFMTRVILSVLFFGIFTPFRLLSGLFGKRFLDTRWDASAESYWNRRKREPFDKAMAEKQY